MMQLILKILFCLIIIKCSDSIGKYVTATGNATTLDKYYIKLAKQDYSSNNHYARMNSLNEAKNSDSFNGYGFYKKLVPEYFRKLKRIKNVPPGLLLYTSGSTGNRSVFEVPVYLLSEQNKKASQVSSNSSFKLLNTSNPIKHRRKRRDITRQNLCENDCVCNQENNFLTVECKFLRSRLYILGPSKYIPRQATSLIIRLSPNAQLRIDEYLFYQNNINKILIEGQPNSRAHVELGPNAFLGNKGPFPEIDIVYIYTVVLRSNAFNGEFKLNISNCNEVLIFSGAFTNTTFHGHFENITDLRPFEKAFISKVQTKIDIINCNIQKLYRLEASLKEIKFSNSTIDIISTGTFDVLTINSIVFEYCDIRVIETGATTERLYSNYLSITACTIGTIEKEAIAGSGITEVIVHNNSINSIEDNAIHLTTISVSITNNTINFLGHHWFRVHDWSNITISNNRFGDYQQISVEKTANPVQCIFYNNFITKANIGSLNFTSTHCHIKEISFHQSCTCKLDWLYKLTTVDLRAESYCKVDTTLKHCFNTSLFNVLKYENDICDYSKKSLDCMKNKVTKKIEDNFIDPNEISGKNGNIIYIYIIVGCSTLLILIIIVSFILIRKIMKSRTIVIPLSEMNTLNSNGTLKQTKLFSNDDRVIIYQTLENMKKKYPPEKYDQVYNNTKKLLEGKLTELEKVLTIGEIVKYLGECENSGEDFVAFTDILYKHLAPTNNQNDPVYAEPNLLRTNEENQTYNIEDGQTNLDHIYAEPHSVQQPLLTNEYASPIDRSDQTNLYTEPMTNAIDKHRHIISPYAIGGHIENTPIVQIARQDQPSTSRNLPDVLNQSKALSAVTPPIFANSSQFHITRSPNTNRKIPKYTIPSSKLRNPKINNSPDSLSSQESNSHSDHSGGSDITYKIDDVVEYADA